MAAPYGASTRERDPQRAGKTHEAPFDAKTAAVGVGLDAPRAAHLDRHARALEAAGERRAGRPREGREERHVLAVGLEHERRAAARQRELFHPRLPRCTATRASRS